MLPSPRLNTLPLSCENYKEQGSALAPVSQLNPLPLKTDRRSVPEDKYLHLNSHCKVHARQDYEKCKEDTGENIPETFVLNELKSLRQLLSLRKCICFDRM